MAIGTPQQLTEKSSKIDQEFYDYYRTSRGQHPRSSTAFWRTGGAQMMLFWSFANLEWISPRPVLFITGDRAHSRARLHRPCGRGRNPALGRQGSRNARSQGLRDQRGHPVRRMKNNYLPEYAFLAAIVAILVIAVIAAKGVA